MIMEDNGWTETPPKGVSCISICSPNEADLAEHWFKTEHKDGLKGYRVFNLDIDGSHSLVEISEIISNAHDVPKETVEGTIIFRMNSFEFEIGLNQLGVFLEEVKNVGRK